MPGPIAIFDSGVGGLTVLRAAVRRLPHEDFVYFGDTAHVPYGTKSPETVRRLSLTHLAFLARLRVKFAVIACNTASAVALSSVRRRLRLPMMGVIGPGVRRALNLTRNGRIGVLGTSTTINSGAYQRELIRAGGKNVRVFAKACPLFVPLIEEGWIRHEVTRRVAAEYTAPLRKAGVDTVILGCTHYPLIKAVIRGAMGSGVVLVDSAEAVGVELERELRKLGLLRTSAGKGRKRFYLTDVAGGFLRVAGRFLQGPIRNVVKVNAKVKALNDVVVRQ